MRRQENQDTVIPTSQRNQKYDQHLKFLVKELTKDRVRWGRSITGFQNSKEGVNHTS